MYHSLGCNCGPDVNPRRPPAVLSTIPDQTINQRRNLVVRLREVLTAFLKVGLVSFGGPVAHLGYLREEFVCKRRWLEDAAYGDLVALCQFLPGPASSQIAPDSPLPWRRPRCCHSSPVPWLRLG